jgi:hypothetical protein
MTIKETSYMYDVLYCTLYDRMCSLQYSTVCTMNITTQNKLETAGDSCICSKLTTDTDCSKLTTTDCSKQTTLKEKHHSTALNCYSLKFSRQNCCGRFFRSRMWVILSLSHLQLLNRGVIFNVVLARHAIFAYTQVADIPID